MGAPEARLGLEPGVLMTLLLLGIGGHKEKKVKAQIIEKWTL